MTNLLALTNLGISSITSRVAELRALGWPIKSSRKKDHGGQRYVEYSL